MTCTSCIYFLNCIEAEENKRECKRYESRDMHLTTKEGLKFEFRKVKR